MVKKRAVFLDRDGVIIYPIIILGLPFSIRDVVDVKMMPGVVEAVSIINRLKLLPIIISNQPDVSRGLLSLSEHKCIEEKVRELSGIDHIYSCIHDRDVCNCRKPRPGLVHNAAKDLDLDIANSYVVGDRWRDIDLAHEIGCKSFFVNRKYKERQPFNQNYEVDSLLDAVKIIESEELKNEMARD